MRKRTVLLGTLGAALVAGGAWFANLDPETRGLLAAMPTDRDVLMWKQDQREAAVATSDEAASWARLAFDALPTAIDYRLSLNDSFAFVLAERIADCILLTGDASLRALAESSAIDVHGVLWVLDQLLGNRIVAPRRLLNALLVFEADPTVRLPGRTLGAYIRRYREHG